jgi:hypothetical protein
MPPTLDEIEVHTQRKGDGGYVKFELESSMAASMEGQPNIVKLEYRSGYALIGTSDRYTIRMLNQEFCALMGDDWSLYASISYKRLTDGTIVH